MNESIALTVHSKAAVRPSGHAAAAWLAIALSAGAAHGAPGGELDSSFGENGRLTIQVPVEIGSDSVGWAIAAEPADGKLLIAGNTQASDSSAFVVLRLNGDGSPDDTFGRMGAAVIRFEQSDAYGTELAVQADRRIIVAGHVRRSANREWRNDLALARLNPDGTLDSTFDGDGRATLNLGGDAEYLAGMALEQDGKIVIAGLTNREGGYNVAFARFNSNGVLDESFGTSAVAGVTLVDSGGRRDQPLGMTRQPDGKFIACGRSRSADSVEGSAKLLAIRVNPDGSVDTGFGTNGVSLVTTRLGGAAQACIALPNGTIVLAGFQGLPGGEDLLLVSLAPDGRLDTTFGTAGISRIDLGGSETIQGIIRLVDGDLGVIGVTAALREGSYPSEWPVFPMLLPSKLPSEMFFARVHSDSGLLDPTFGNNGVTLVDFGVQDKRSWAYGRSVIQLTDGKLVAVGTSIDALNSDTPQGERPSVAVARLDPVGSGNIGFAGFAETFARAAESDREIVVNVRRTGGSTGVLSVDYSTVAGAAMAPRDFTHTAGTLTWMSGEVDAKTIVVPIADDGAVEGSEGLFIALSNSTGGLAASGFAAWISDEPIVSGSGGSGGPVIGGGGASGGGASGGSANGSGGGGAIGGELLMLTAMLTLVAVRRRLIGPSPSR